VAGRGSEAGHYVDLTEFFSQQPWRDHGPGHGQVLRRIPRQFGKYWAIPAEGDAVGWSYRKDWFEDPAEMEAFKAKYGYDLAPPEDWAQLRDIAEFFHRPDENRYGVAIYTDNSYDALVMGVENAIFSFGGELGTTRPTRSTASSTRTRTSRRSRPTASSTASRLRAGPRPSSSRTTRRSPRAWRR
jgi:multiple sugar transport system substrate-binding protein